MAQKSNSPMPHPDSPDGWIVIADREISNIGGSLAGNLSNDSVIQHAVAGTEATLKAIIWKREGWAKWPMKTKKTKYLYYHDLETMLEKSGLKERLLVDGERAASWDALVNANTKQYRYSPGEVQSRVAWSVARSARHPDWGVVPWLRKAYQRMI